MSPESCALCGKNFGVFNKKKNLGSRAFCKYCAERVKKEVQRRKVRKKKGIDTAYCPDIDCTYFKAIRVGEKCPKCNSIAQEFKVLDALHFLDSKNVIVLREKYEESKKHRSREDMKRRLERATRNNKTERKRKEERIAAEKQAKFERKKALERAEIKRKYRSFRVNQLEKGLIPYLDEQGIEKWGTHEQVEQWKRIRFDIDNAFSSYTPRQFEVLVSQLFTQMGYETRLGEYSQDFGIDLVASKGDDVIVVEVKQWTPGNNVGAETVRSVLGALWKAEANKAVLITTSDFTVQAREQAQGSPVELWNGKTFSELVTKYLIKSRPTDNQTSFNDPIDVGAEVNCPVCKGTGSIENSIFIGDQGAITPALESSECPLCKGWGIPQGQPGEYLHLSLKLEGYENDDEIVHARQLISEGNLREALDKIRKSMSGYPDAVELHILAVIISWIFGIQQINNMSKMDMSGSRTATEVILSVRQSMTETIRYADQAISLDQNNKVMKTIRKNATLILSSIDNGIIKKTQEYEILQRKNRTSNVNNELFTRVSSNQPSILKDNFYDSFKDNIINHRCSQCGQSSEFLTSCFSCGEALCPSCIQMNGFCSTCAEMNRDEI